VRRSDGSGYGRRGPAAEGGGLALCLEAGERVLGLLGCGRGALRLEELQGPTPVVARGSRIATSMMRPGTLPKRPSHLVAGSQVFEEVQRLAGQVDGLAGLTVEERQDRARAEGNRPVEAVSGLGGRLFGPEGGGPKEFGVPSAGGGVGAQDKIV